MTSTSGATITVVKSAPPGRVRDRLHAQAAWLSMFDDPGIVSVLEEREDGYVMPCLASRPTPERSRVAVMRDVLTILRRVWTQPGYRPNLTVTWAYLHKLNQPELLDFLPNQFEFGKMIERVGVCNTHGDPTLENVLFDNNGSAVLIDPLPDVVWGGRLPSVRALDLGKLLQSAMRYEAVKRGDIPYHAWDTDLVTEIQRTVRHDFEWELTKIFCAIHVARFIPYQTAALRSRWQEDFPTILKELASDNLV